MSGCPAAAASIGCARRATPSDFELFERVAPIVRATRGIERPGFRCAHPGYDADSLRPICLVLRLAALAGPRGLLFLALRLRQRLVLVRVLRHEQSPRTKKAVEPEWVPQTPTPRSSSR